MVLKDKNKTQETEDKKAEDQAAGDKDGKGVIYCKTKGCTNSLYKWTSSKDPRYCVDCL